MIIKIPAKTLSDTSDQISQWRSHIEQDGIIIIEGVFDDGFVTQLTTYLSQIGRSSLPNYHPIEAGAPNFHRLNQNDPRSYVQGCFHQFVFFPWNQDVFQLFQRFESIFWLKNTLHGLPKDRYLGAKPDSDCTAKIAFQFYPKGCGHLQFHQDPKDFHQNTLAVVQLSQKGRDFTQGGLKVTTQSGTSLDVDAETQPGDVVLMSPQITHGIDPIDPDVSSDWTAFEGRWSAVLAINKLANTSRVANSVVVSQSS